MAQDPVTPGLRLFTTIINSTDDTAELKRLFINELSQRGYEYRAEDPHPDPALQLVFLSRILVQIIDEGSTDVTNEIEGHLLSPRSPTPERQLRESQESFQSRIANSVNPSDTDVESSSTSDDSETPVPSPNISGNDTASAETFSESSHVLTPRDIDDEDNTQDSHGTLSDTEIEEQNLRGSLSPVILNSPIGSVSTLSPRSVQSQTGTISEGHDDERDTSEVVQGPEDTRTVKLRSNEDSSCTPPGSPPSQIEKWIPWKEDPAIRQVAVVKPYVIVSKTRTITTATTVTTTSTTAHPDTSVQPSTSGGHGRGLAAFRSAVLHPRRPGRGSSPARPIGLGRGWQRLPGGRLVQSRPTRSFSQRGFLGRQSASSHYPRSPVYRQISSDEENWD